MSPPTGEMDVTAVNMCLFSDKDIVDRQETSGKNRNSTKTKTTQ